VWLAPAATTPLPELQRSVVEAVRATGAEVHPHYRPGDWLPHLTLAPRLSLADLGVVASRVNEVLPLTAEFSRTALVQTHTGEVQVLPWRSCHLSGASWPAVGHTRPALGTSSTGSSAPSSGPRRQRRHDAAGARGTAHACRWSRRTASQRRSSWPSTHSQTLTWTSTC